MRGRGWVSGGSGASLASISITTADGHAYVQFGANLIVIANAAATFDASDIQF